MAHERDTGEGWRVLRIVMFALLCAFFAERCVSGWNYSLSAAFVVFGLVLQLPRFVSDCLRVDLS